jgi:hypothetical protein
MAEVTSSSGLGPEVPGGGEQRAAFRAALSAIPQAKVKQYHYWLTEYRTDWRREIPYRIHEKGTYGLGSAPPYSSEFVAYIGDLCKDERCSCKRRKKGERKDDARYRTTRAFRKLRKAAPREFDAMYMYCMHDMTPAQIALSMNEEMERKNRPERYYPESVALLLFSGVDKVMSWW